MKSVLVMALGISLFAACVKDPVVVSPNVVNDDRTLSLRVPIPMLHLDLEYKPENRNVLATISPLTWNSTRNCSFMSIAIDSSTTIFDSHTINLRRLADGYAFYIPLSYAPYFSYIHSGLRLNVCGAEFSLTREQVEQVERFVNASVTWHNTFGNRTR